MDTAKTAMKNMGLPSTLQNKVINYLLYTQGNLDKQREFSLMNNMISPSLKMEIIRSIFSQVIVTNPIFGGGNEDLIDHVLQSISTRSFLPEDSIIKQDEDGTDLYFLYQGECETLVMDENSETHQIDILSPGAMFGEISIISNCKRTATIQSLNYCTCATLTEGQIKDITRKYPEVYSKLRARRKEYNDCWKRFLRKLILSVEYFRRCKPETIEELIYSMRQEYVESNKVIFKAGESIENLQFISNGTIDIMLRFDDGKEIVIDHLRQGACFGAYSIVDPTPIMFTIKAKTHLKIQVLDFEVLEELRLTHEDLNRELERYEKYIEEFGLPI
jgi:CRP-like cAMP-binding protein